MYAEVPCPVSHLKSVTLKHASLYFQLVDGAMKEAVTVLGKEEKAQSILLLLAGFSAR